MVVTGAASGIGLATARRLRGDGYRVFAVDLAESTECDAGRTVDVGNPDAVAVLADVPELRDGVAGVINVAGVSVRAPFADLDEQTWARIMDVNLGGAYRVTRCFWRRMLDAGRGVVVNVASTTAFRAEPGIAAYSAAKAGLLALTRCLALEGGPAGVRANAVAPGVTRTPLTLGRGWTEEEWAQRVARVPLGHIAEPEDIADVIAFLAGDDSRHVSGEVIVVDGGAALR
jgi:NAD(P)-dependent dehydrogenase (short-subunit alcohol dehydrogenase family)